MTIYKHYTYIISNIKENKHYIGSRTCKDGFTPEEDIGILYFSSSSDDNFIQDQKINPQNYTYQIINKYQLRKEALWNEVCLHKIFNVGSRQDFYNKSRQTAVGFNTQGTISPKKLPQEIKVLKFLFKKYKVPFASKYFIKNYKNQKISDFSTRSKEWRTYKSESLKIYYKNNIHPNLNKKSTKTEQERKDIAKIRQNIITLEDGTQTTSYLLGAQKGANTRENTFVEYEGKTISVKEKLAIDSTNTRLNSLTVYNDEFMTIAEMGARKAAETMESTILENGLTIKEERTKNMKETKNNSKVIFEGEEMLKTKMIAILTHRRMANEFEMFEGVLLSKLQIRAIKSARNIKNKLCIFEGVEMTISEQKGIKIRRTKEAKRNELAFLQES